MDSLTQFVLGAGVGAAVLGPRLGARRAALIGGVLGTLPDLDVFWRFEDPVDAFTLHRGATHSVFVHAVVAPAVGIALARLFRGAALGWARATAGAYLIFATHALIDAITVYGTRIFWPVHPDPIGLGALFVVDPLYTLPLVVAVVWALCVRHWSARLRTALTVALVASTAYAGWGLAAQRIVLAKADRVFAEAGIAPDRRLAIAAPMTTALWKIVAVEGERYYNLYLPIAGGAPGPPIYAHDRGAGVLACLGENGAAGRLEAFARGYVMAERRAERIVMADLRMGLTPNYVFRFAVADAAGAPVFPERLEGERAASGDWPWFFAALGGSLGPRPAERAALLDPPDPDPEPDVRLAAAGCAAPYSG